MTHFYAVDSGGTSRAAKRLFAVDSGGTSRLIKRGFVIDSGGTARLFFQAADQLTMVAGEGTNVHGAVIEIGYAPGFGSLSPAVLGDGKTVVTLDDVTTTVTRQIQISGFSADPGIGYLYSLTGNGLTLLGASATYSYSGGLAGWEWSIASGSEFAVGQTYPIQIVRG